MSPLPDFVDVQLSAAGVKFVGSGSLRVANAHFSYEFTPGKPVQVTKAYEWGRVLSQVSANGEALLEIAPPARPAKPGTRPAQTDLVVKEPEDGQ